MQSPEPLTGRRGLVLALLAGVVVYALVRRGVVGARTLLLLAALFGSVILHEVSHGAVALGFGDDTAKRAGRLTLNPVSHVDPVGTVILPTILVLAGASPFGWAKPVPVSPAKLRSPRNQSLLVSLAGPAVNIVLALVAAVVLRGVIPDGGYAGSPPLAHEALLSLGLVNVVLAVFNLIPLPPLDGSAVVERLLPARWWPGYLRVRQYSMAILLILVLLLPRALNRVFEPALDGWLRLLT